MAVFTALAIASIGLQVYGQIRGAKAAKKQGEAAKAAADSQADLADYNASVATLQQTDALERGTEEENRFRMGVRGMVGTQRAAQAAGNVDVNFGSAVDVQADATLLGEHDALTIRTNAGREAWGYSTQAEDLHRRADIARKEGVYAEKAGKAAATSHYIEAGGTILGGASNLLETKYGMGRR